jgi:GAF domain-containing protein
MTRRGREYEVLESFRLLGDIDPAAVAELGLEPEIESLCREVDSRLRLVKQYETVRYQSERNAVIMGISEEVSQTLDFDEVAERALDQVVAHLSREDRKVFGTLERLNEAEGVLLDIVGVGYAPGRKAVPLSLGQGIVGWVAERGEPLLVRDVRDEQWKDVFYDVMAEEVRAELAVPLKREGKVWGVLNVESPQVGAFDEEDQLLLEGVAIQFIVALNNAERHGALLRQRQRWEVVAEINRVISETLDFGEVAERALNQVVEHLSREGRKVFGTLERFDETEGVLLDIVGVGYAPGRGAEPLPLGQGIVGWVAERREPLLVEDVRDEQWKGVFRHVMAEEIRSELAVPLVREDKLWGVLNVESPEVGAFDEEDQLLLEGVATQIIVALNNAEQYEQLQEERRKVAAIQRRAVLGEAAAGLSHALGNDLGIIPRLTYEIGGIVEREDEVVVENLDTIRRNVRHALDLSESFIKRFAAKPAPPSPSDPNLVLAKAVEIRKQGLSDNVELLTQYAENLPFVPGSVELVEAFAELMTNAVKAMPGGGRLEVGTRMADGNSVEFRFSDTGRGIPKEKQAEVFELLQRIEADALGVPGHRIGLAYVSTVVEDLGGKIDFSSEGTGKGSTFVIRLPVVKGQ